MEVERFDLKSRQDCREEEVEGKVHGLAVKETLINEAVVGVEGGCCSY